jgi:hypothetical protein
MNLTADIPGYIITPVRHPGPVKLQWVYVPEDLTYVARVPAWDCFGRGHFIIYAICRPQYCDRGQFHVLVESEVVQGLDASEGFPRYYFRLENLMEEMELWVNKREAVITAAKSLPARSA